MDKYKGCRKGWNIAARKPQFSWEEWMHLIGSLMVHQWMTAVEYLFRNSRQVRNPHGGNKRALDEQAGRPRPWRALDGFNDLPVAYSIAVKMHELFWLACLLSCLPRCDPDYYLLVPMVGMILALLWPILMSCPSFTGTRVKTPRLVGTELSNNFFVLGK